MKKKIFVASLLALAGTGAMAQSAFEGAYGQLGVGYENNSIASRNFVFTDNSGGGGDFSTSAPSSTGGGFSSSAGLGYNFSVAPQWLVGIGVDYTFTNVTTSTKPIYSGADAGADNNYKVKNRYSIFLTPAYEIAKDKLVYVKGGFSSQSVVWQGQNDASELPSISKTVNGYVAGLGYKQLIDKNIYIFGEANYYSYSSFTISGPTSSGNTVAQTQTPTAYQFLIGAGYKF